MWALKPDKKPTKKFFLSNSADHHFTFRVLSRYLVNGSIFDITTSSEKNLLSDFRKRSKALFHFIVSNDNASLKVKLYEQNNRA